jgi:hypothetical protein
MNGLIRFSLSNWYAIVVFVLSIVVIGALTVTLIPIDILPVNDSPAVQVLTFYGGMPASGSGRSSTQRQKRPGPRRSGNLAVSFETPQEGRCRRGYHGTGEESIHSF